MPEAEAITAHSVSVLIPCFNCGSTVAEAVASVVSQDGFVGEILIYDDASTDDGTRSTLNRIASEMPAVRVVFSETNKGAGVARARLIAAARHPLSAFIDADDVWCAGKLQRQLRVMEDPDVILCYTAYLICGERLEPRSLRSVPERTGLRAMLMANVVPTSTTMFRTEAAQKIAFPPLRRRQDYAFWLLLMRDNPKGVCVGLQEPLVLYRDIPNSLSSSQRKNLVYNFRVFREAMGMNIVVSCFFLTLNIFNRVFNSRIRLISEKP